MKHSEFIRKNIKPEELDEYIEAREEEAYECGYEAAVETMARLLMERKPLADWKRSFDDGQT